MLRWQHLNLPRSVAGLRRATLIPAPSGALRSSRQSAPAGNPDVTGTWTAKLENSGLVWTLTVQNNPDETFKFVGVAQDHGSYSAANGSWSSISAVTSQTKSGAYQVLDAHDVEFTGPNGRAVWQRQ